MKISMHATKPLDHVFTLTATMTMAHWKELLKEIDESNRDPIWQLKKEIRRAIKMVEKEFEVEPDTDRPAQKWCDCDPSHCRGPVELSEIMHCREKSPLLKLLPNAAKNRNDL